MSLIESNRNNCNNANTTFSNCKIDHLNDDYTYNGNYSKTDSENNSFDSSSSSSSIINIPTVDQCLNRRKKEILRSLNITTSTSEITGSESTEDNLEIKHNKEKNKKMKNRKKNKLLSQIQYSRQSFDRNVESNKSMDIDMNATLAQSKNCNDDNSINNKNNNTHSDSLNNIGNTHHYIDDDNTTDGVTNEASCITSTEMERINSERLELLALNYSPPPKVTFDLRYVVAPMVNQSDAPFR